LQPIALLPKLEDDHYSVKQIFKSLRFDRLIAGGMICAILLEIALGDWSNIFAREYLEIKGGLITLPYILFMSALIVGRLNISKIIAKVPINRAANIGSLIGGTFFLLGITVAFYVAQGTSDRTKRAIKVFAVIALAQGAIGYVQYFTGIPEVLVAAHLLGATLVWIASWRIRLSVITQNG
jgi:hypothetical protein